MIRPSYLKSWQVHDCAPNWSRLQDRNCSSNCWKFDGSSFRQSSDTSCEDRSGGKTGAMRMDATESRKKSERERSEQRIKWATKGWRRRPDDAISFALLPFFRVISLPFARSFFFFLRVTSLTVISFAFSFFFKATSLSPILFVLFHLGSITSSPVISFALLLFVGLTLCMLKSFLNFF